MIEKLLLQIREAIPPVAAAFFVCYNKSITRTYLRISTEFDQKRFEKTEIQVSYR